ncbi:hypothetical protein [uncultured Algibacter sp.]|uniref:hypothetical protein n=1 Tax=uncultured Algibacter sp. TaxID=298659 RepID=UPI002606F72A|nr:hypothetical protein [uncultured Algibacter sp.]
MISNKNKKSNLYQKLILKTIDTYVYHVVLKKSYKQQLGENLASPSIQNYNLGLAS